MTEPISKNREEPWEERLRKGLGEPPTPDFASWRLTHADALLTPLSLSTHDAKPSYWRTMMKSKNWITATLVMAGCALFFFWPAGMEKTAVAGTIPGIDDPKTMTWTTTFYIQTTSADKERTWIQAERRLHAYRHPGQYRQTLLDPEGNARAVEISDARAGRTLRLDLKDKKAILKLPTGMPDPRGPFAWVGEAVRDRRVAGSFPVKSISLLGKKEIDQKQANVVRAIIDSGNVNGPQRRDFYFDETSKRLLGIWMPNQSDLDLEAAVDRKGAPEKTFYMMMPIASLVHEIDLNPKIDAKDFSLDTPAGYTLEKLAKPTLTEEEMVAYLGACVRFNGSIFPDSPYPGFDMVKFNRVSLLAEEKQSGADKEMIAQFDKFQMREIHRPPVRVFMEDHAVADSFHYVGAGAKLGDGKQIVCWFTLKGSTNPRAVYADLKVRDVTASDLPFDLKK